MCVFHTITIGTVIIERSCVIYNGLKNATCKHTLTLRFYICVYICVTTGFMFNLNVGGNSKVTCEQDFNHETNRFCFREVYIYLNTRKSSCVNARGIPPAAYQVLHLLSYPGGTYPGRGVPILAGGVPTPSLDRGYLPIWTWPGYPLGVNRQTPVKTVPSPILRMRAVARNIPKWAKSTLRPDGRALRPVESFSGAVWLSLCPTRPFPLPAIPKKEEQESPPA